MIQIIFSLVFVVICFGLIGLVLVQKGRGGGLTGAFGGGGSETWLGGLQSKEIVRVTTWVAVAFFALTILRDMVPPKRVGADVEDLMGTTGATSSEPADQQPAGEAADQGTAPVAPEAGGAPAPAAPAAAGSAAPAQAPSAPQPAAPPAAPAEQGGTQ